MSWGGILDRVVGLIFLGKEYLCWELNDGELVIKCEERKYFYGGNNDWKCSSWEGIWCVLERNKFRVVGVERVRNKI